MFTSIPSKVTFTDIDIAFKNNQNKIVSFLRPTNAYCTTKTLSAGSVLQDVIKKKFIYFCSVYSAISDSPALRGCHGPRAWHMTPSPHVASLRWAGRLLSPELPGDFLPFCFCSSALSAWNAFSSPCPFPHVFQYLTLVWPSL